MKSALCLWLGVLTAMVSHAQGNFDAFAEETAAAWVRQNPQGATRRQYFSGAEQDALDRDMLATGPLGLPLDRRLRQQLLDQHRKEREQLARFDRARLTPVQRLAADAMQESIDQTLALAELEDHWFIFNQMSGLHVSVVNFLTQAHPVQRPRDLENYVARLGKVAGMVDLGIEWTREQEEKGIRPPRFILNLVVGQLDRFLAPEPAQNILVTSLAERAAALKELSAADRTAFTANATRMVREQIIPAYRRLRVLVADQVTRANDDAGLWRLPKGAEAYAAALQQNTNTKLSADEIHALGQREVARIEGEMDVILRELGYREGSVKDRYAAMNEKILPPSDPDPRPAMVEEYARVVRDAERRSEALFDLRPKAAIEVRREPPITEPTMAAHYTEPAPDGTRPGIFWAPLPDSWRTSIWVGAGLRSVTYHEAVPGHHFQIALQQELPGLPRYLQLGIFGGSGAFSEGWALYAEKLAAESGWYGDDKPGRLGQLNLELFRARRLVADTGLHAKRWTRQQAIDYGMPATEVDRYVTWPGQACSYKIGELEILRLRAKAREALGAKFSLQKFHNVVLGSGSVSLSVLGRLVDEYIAAAR